MRIAFVIALGALAIGVGQARAHCPLTASAPLTGVDPAAANNRDEQSAWRATGLTMMNRPVPYVVVQRHEGQIATLYFRLGRDTMPADREYGGAVGPLPRDVEARFRELYLHNADCNDNSCIGSADIDYGFGRLESVHLGGGWLEIDDQWTGSAVDQARADQDPADDVSRLAVYLSCRYNALDRD
jgi:hypothetical protein